MDKFEPPYLWKRQGVLLGIHAGRTNKEISDFLRVSKRMVEKVRKELKDSGFDYEATSERKKHHRRSDSVRTPEFIAEVQEIIKNEPNKSMRAIAREKGVSEKVIRLVVHEDIMAPVHSQRKDVSVPSDASRAVAAVSDSSAKEKAKKKESDENMEFGLFD